MSLTDQQWCPTSVQVTVLQARGLRAKGKSGTNDAYAVMVVGKEKYQTSVVEKSVAPMWKEEAAFDLPQQLHGGGGDTERSTLHVHVLHRALVGPDKLLGKAVIGLLQLSEDKTRNKIEWFKLLDKSGKADKDRGEVLVHIQFMRNNMTASMFDLSAAGKSRSRLGKFKDKVRGKKKESDAVSAVLPSFTQVLTDSEEEGNGNGEVAAHKDEKKKKHKLKLFSTKSNLQRSISQSMSVLPGKNSSLSGSQSSGLNVDSSEGKKKFKFMIHKRSGSSGSKDSSSEHQKHGAAEQNDLCINASHICTEEPQTRTSSIGSNFSLTSSGHGSMEDVPVNSPPSVDSLRAVSQYSPWTEEEEETADGENIKEDEGKLRREEEERIRIEEMRRKEEEEERVRRQEAERLAEEKRRQERRILEEEEKRQREEEEMVRMEEKRVQEERVRLEEERKLSKERRRLEEEERRRTEEEKVKKEAEERIRKEAEDKIRREEEERIQEEVRRQEEERRKIEEEKLKKEEKERIRREEELRIQEEVRRQEEERRKIEEEKLKKEEKERIRREEEKRIQEERRRQEEEKRKTEEERFKMEEKERVQEERRREDKRMFEEQKVKKEEEERIRREEEEIIQEERRRQEEERRKIEEEKVKKEEEGRIRKEEEKKIQEERRRQEEERRKFEEEKIKKEEEEKIRREEEERIQEERRRKDERRFEEEKVKKEEEERIKREKEERIWEEMRQEEEKRKIEEEKVKKEEEERIRWEEEERIQEEMRQEEEERRSRREEERVQEEMRKQEEEMRKQEEEMRKQEEEEMFRRQEECEVKRRLEEQEKSGREEVERKKKEEEKRTRIEAFEKIRALERVRVEEKRRRNEEERRLIEEKRILEKERMRIEEKEKMQREEEEMIREEEGRKHKGEVRARKEEEEYETLVEEKRRQEEQERRIEEEERKEEQEMIVIEEQRKHEEEEERMFIEEEEENKREEEERIRMEEKVEEEAKKLENEKLTRNVEEQKKLKVPGMKSEAERSAEITSTNPYDEKSPAGPYSSTAKESTVQQRSPSAASSLGRTAVSTDDKDLISTQREKRPAPQPPGRNLAERQSQREQDRSALCLAQSNDQSKGKDVKTVSVSPQRTVHMIAPLSRSPTLEKNTQSLMQSSTANGTANIAKHSKRPAPSRPLSVEEEPSSGPKTALSSDGKIPNEYSSEVTREPIVHGLNPFEDEDKNEHTAADYTSTGSIQWPPAVAKAADDNDAVSQAKIKSSKKARAPPLPAKTAATSSSSVNLNTEGGHDRHDTGAAITDNNVTQPCDPEEVQETLVQESQAVMVPSAEEKTGGRKEGPPTPSRRLQPVKPLNSLRQQPVSVIQGEKDNRSTGFFYEVREQTKVNGTGLKGPYSQLTQKELISLVLKQENQLSQKDKRISELEQYIDNLLVRVIEEKPSILISMNSLK